jgi:hypothetical protein
MPCLCLRTPKALMDVSMLMISTKWENLFIYFRPPLEIIVVLTKNRSVKPTCVHSASALGLPF